MKGLWWHIQRARLGAELTWRPHCVGSVAYAKAVPIGSHVVWTDVSPSHHQADTRSCHGPAPPQLSTVVVIALVAESAKSVRVMGCSPGWRLTRVTNSPCGHCAGFGCRRLTPRP
jgi:hypothetical protein